MYWLKHFFRGSSLFCSINRYLFILAAFAVHLVLRLHLWAGTYSGVICIAIFFFLSGFSFTDTGNWQDTREREGAIFYSTLPLPTAHAHSGIYLQLCVWNDYHVFLTPPVVFTRLLLDEIYHLIEWPFH